MPFEWFELVDSCTFLLTWYITLRSLKGHCHGNQFVAKSAFFADQSFIITLPFLNVLQYRNSNFKRLNGLNFSALCTILVRFSPVTSEFTLLKNFCDDTAGKIRHMPNISEYSGLIITNFRCLAEIWVGIIIPIFVWQSPKGRCYGNQLNLGDVCRRRHKRPLLFAVAFNNRSDDCKATFKRVNGNNSATLSTNLMNFRPIISELMLLKRNFCRDSTAIWRRSFVTMALRNGLEDRNFDFRRVIGNHFCTSYRNTVRFVSVSPEFKT